MCWCAPVTAEGVRDRAVYLPEGSAWTSAWTESGSKVGPWLQCPAPLERIPVFFRDGGALPADVMGRPTPNDPAAKTTTRPVPALAANAGPSSAPHQPRSAPSADDQLPPRGARCRAVQGPPEGHSSWRRTTSCSPSPHCSWYSRLRRSCTTSASAFSPTPWWAGLISGVSQTTPTSYKAGCSGHRSCAVLEYGIGVMAVTLACSVTFAVLLDFEYVRFVRAFKLIFFLPYAVPGSIAVMIWGFLLEPQLGTYPLLAKDAGFGTIDFLGTHLVLFSIGSIAVWALTGFNMLVIYTALKGVPLENIEAAIVDGASKWQIATRVKLPQIRPVVMGMGFLGVLGALQLFTEPSILSVLTDSISTQYTPAMLVDNTISTQSNNNYAAAMAFVLSTDLSDLCRRAPRDIHSPQRGV